MDASIVIATRNRRWLLEQTLRSIAAIDHDIEFEVVIADHGSSDGTDGLIASYAGAFPVTVIDVPYRHESIADPKNAGARAAKGKILIFVDSGMICPPHFIEAHVERHATAGDLLLAAAIFGWDSEDDGDDFWRSLDLARLPAALPARFADPRALRWSESAGAPWMLVWGANMSMRRDAFLAAGGFDSDMSGWGWDDLELAYRLCRAGLHVSYGPDAWAVHYPHPRAPLERRMSSARENWLRAYLRHREPALETWEACDFWDHGRCHQLLMEVALRIADRLPSPPPRRGSADRRVLFGFRPSNDGVAGDTFIAPGATPQSAAECVRSFGIRTWLPEAYADTALVAPTLLAYDQTPSPGWPPLAHFILKELSRVAKRLVLVDPPGPETSEMTRLRHLAATAGVSMLGVSSAVANEGAERR
jgi:glycosyltransferase involved in cell wall biosynthesis